MENMPLWTLTQEAYQALVPAYEPVLDKFRVETEVSGSGIGLLLAAVTFEPETISPQRLQVRGPYTAASAYLERLALLAGKGFLAEIKADQFRLTQSGRSRTDGLIRDVRSAMAQADPLPPAAGGRLAVLLEKLVLASLDAGPPPSDWSIALAHRLMPAPSPPLPFSEQAISCLNGYRDDAHLAAWQPSGLSAEALESLTLLWRRQADSLEAIAQRLQHRGHPSQVYADALETLRKTGFVEGEDSDLRLTASGDDFRQQVEADTDRYFFAPWGHLNPDEKNELAGLLSRLNKGLRSSLEK